MKLLMTVEQRYKRTPDGKVWTADQHDYSMLSLYTEPFDHIKILSRVEDVDSVPDNYLRANGDNVKIVPIPHYRGMKDYLTKYFQVREAALNAITYEDVIIFRAPSLLADAIIPQLLKRNYPYGMFVTSDPRITFGKGSMNNVLRPILRQRFINNLRKQCETAYATAYVTNSFLQQAYPCPEMMISISDVSIGESVANEIQTLPDDGETLQIAFVGSLDQLYKAPDILIDSIRICVQKGHNIHLKLIGDGIYRQQVEEQVADSKLQNHVTMYGKLPGVEAVRAELEKSHLFVLPSRAEGLPRVMIEAMSCGLACIGTTVGGIPELLPKESLVPPNNAEALANKIEEFITNPDRMKTEAQQNLEVASEYTSHKLYIKRQKFLEYLKKNTSEWTQSI